MARTARATGALAGLVQRLKTFVQAARGGLASPRPARLDAAGIDDVLRVLDKEATLKAQLLDALRETTRLSGRGPLRRSSQVDLAELVRSTAESLALVADAQQIAIRPRCAAASVVIPADARDLTHVVGRLLACAIASSARGSTVDCQLSLSADWVRLVVRAPGADVGPARVPRVLESSDGRASDRDSAEWNALGLASVRTLVVRHGGIVRIERQAHDSILTLSLPGESAFSTSSGAHAF